MSIKAGLIGHGISGSLTPAMHEAEGRALGLDYSYTRIDAATPEHEGKPLSALIDWAEAQGFAGVNITHPFKTEAAEIADDLSQTATELAAVNTMLFQGGKRIGHNTDYTGYRSALGAVHDIGPMGRVLLMGAGGAGGAVALALLDQGCDALTICDRAPGRAEALATQMKRMRASRAIKGISSLALVDLGALDGVVNATPLGMHGHAGMVIDPALLPKTAWVSDIVYFPMETQLLRTAKACGLRTIDGGGMAVFQAVAAFALITGQKPDPKRMRDSFLRLTSTLGECPRESA